MSPLSPIPFSGTPRRKILTPVRTTTQSNLQSFPTASKIRQSLAQSSYNPSDLSVYNREDETNSLSALEEYVPPKYIVAHEDMKELTNNFMKQFDSILKEWCELAKDKNLKSEKQTSSLQERHKKLETDLASIKLQSSDLSKQHNIEKSQQEDLASVVAEINKQNDEIFSSISRLSTRKDALDKKLLHKVNGTFF
ncbi:hypothetical protein BB561_002158 [Smittium simulii]|uniref:Uncharacterized protein n=1 Tax=Smittium simulii TaxID=133385 RepID=A0A2T9YRK1_9FUNG|nr:hypothetical protein BB561_002158 [Smittium simulii]